MTVTHSYNRGKLHALRAYQAPKKRNMVQNILHNKLTAELSIAVALAVFTLGYYNII